MNEFDKNPDEFWRSVFDDVAETPPPRVWDAIERRLDEPDEAGIVPLWGAGFFANRPVSWGMGVAATVALLLVGWWLSQSPETRQPVASQQTKPFVTKSPQPDAVALNQPVHQESSTALSSASNKQQQRNGAGYADASSTKAPTLSGRLPGSVASAQPAERLAQQARSVSSRSGEAGRLSLENASKNPSGDQIVIAVPPTSPAPSALLSSSAAKALAAKSLVDVPEEAPDQLAFRMQTLNPRPMKLRSAGQIHRIVWVQPYEVPQKPALAESNRSSREHWVSLNVMPGSFNPAVSVQAAQPALASAYGSNITNSSQPTVKNRAELSMSYQANAGVQLNDHWSVESGVGYLAGHATIDSPSEPYPASMLSFGKASGMPLNTLYTDVLRQSVQRNTVVTADNAISTNWASASAYNSLYAYDPQTRQTLTNDYQFVQVPIQVGYQLRPRKRLGLALLGGFLTNIFLRNTVENQLVIKPEDGVYQPVTLAAAMGARFQYRSSQRWSASLAGMYQPTLGSATKSSSSIQSRPTTTGMSFGVDYHF
jgi:hypothetical protein